MKRVAVFASGGGSNLGALVTYLDALGPGAAAGIVLVVSDRPGAGALDRAARRGIASATLDDPSAAVELLEILAEHRVDLIVLAGYLKRVPHEVTEAFRGWMINVHPALLPRHGGPGMYGIRVHRAVLAARDPESGATVHFVDADYDRGPVIARARVPVEAGDTADALAARVLVAEHFLLPRTVHALARELVALHRDGAVSVATTAPALFSGAPAGVTIALGSSAR